MPSAAKQQPLSRSRVVDVPSSGQSPNASVSRTHPISTDARSADSLRTRPLGAARPDRWAPATRCSLGLLVNSAPQPEPLSARPPPAPTHVRGPFLRPRFTSSKQFSARRRVRRLKSADTNILPKFWGASNVVFHDSRDALDHAPHAQTVGGGRPDVPEHAADAAHAMSSAARRSALRPNPVGRVQPGVNGQIRTSSGAARIQGARATLGSPSWKRQQTAATDDRRVRLSLVGVVSADAQQTRGTVCERMPIWRRRSECCLTDLAQIIATLGPRARFAYTNGRPDRP